MTFASESGIMRSYLAATSGKIYRFKTNSKVSVSPYSGVSKLDAL